MKCPYTIEPHQIQGLDFINIYPLILWLIKYSSEFREAKEDELRKFAVIQYEKNHIFESDRANYMQKEKLLRNLAMVQVSSQITTIYDLYSLAKRRNTSHKPHTNQPIWSPQYGYLKPPF